MVGKEGVGYELVEGGRVVMIEEEVREMDGKELEVLVEGSVDGWLEEWGSVKFGEGRKIVRGEEGKEIVEL